MIEILKLASLFTHFVIEEVNKKLYKEVAEEELQLVLHSFKKNKNAGPYEWIVEFFFGFVWSIRDRPFRGY